MNRYTSFLLGGLFLLSGLLGFSNDSLFGDSHSDGGVQGLSAV